MEAYKFETTVQKNGIIRIPEISRFANREVEVFIMLKPETGLHPERSQDVQQFLSKWRGLLEPEN